MTSLGVIHLVTFSLTALKHNGNDIPPSLMVDLSAFPSYHLSYPVATYMGYPPPTGTAGYYYGGISTFGAGGTGVFYPGAWWRSSLRIDSH
uniref:Uncharacterized protein n=1 Tax=Oryza sativa subsp. japonica TaxID=39947 RepID=Q53Q80_ORYSJ|nr:hypothetical protein LOC_Os11g17630 [Oryza sativa Japonica Group]